MTTLYPIGYEDRLVELDELEGIHGPKMHPEYRRRLFNWIEAQDGLIGIGGGWRETGKQPDKPGFAPEGQSFHQYQKFTSGITAYCAVDLVARNGGGDHRSPTWAEVPRQGTALAAEWGVHCNIDSEPWHIQPVEIDGWASWKNAGSPDPKTDYPIPGEEMKPLIVPERAYDSRPAEQGGVTEGLLIANKGLPLGPFRVGETRRIVVGMCQSAHVHLTVIGTKPGFVTISGSTTKSTASLANVDQDGVAAAGAPIATPEGAIFVTAPQGGVDVVVDVYARG